MPWPHLMGASVAILVAVTPRQRVLAGMETTLTWWAKVTRGSCASFGSLVPPTTLLPSRLIDQLSNMFSLPPPSPVILCLKLSFVLLGIGYFNSRHQFSRRQPFLSHLFHHPLGSRMGLSMLHAPLQAVFVTICARETH